MAHSWGLALFSLFVSVAISPNPTKPEQVRHPEDVLMWIQCDTPIMMGHQQKRWNVALGGLVVGARYRLQLQILQDSLLLFQTHYSVKADGNQTTLFPITLPPLAGGWFSIYLELRDTFMGLDDDDAFLAAKTLRVQIPVPLKWHDRSRKDMVCREEQLLPDAAVLDSQTPVLDKDSNTDDISLVSIARSEHALSLLRMLRRWDGPASVALYARTEEEDAALRRFVAHHLQPLALNQREKKPLHVRLVSTCRPAHAHPPRPADTFAFPLNTLRAAAVAAAPSDLVLVLDPAFLTSDNARRDLLASHVMGDVRGGRAVLILPAVSPANGSWPHPDDGAVSKEQILQRAREGSVAVPGGPSNLFEHGAVDYSHWLAAAGPYEVPYTFLFAPYFVVNKRRWGGLYRGLYDQRFVRRGADRAQLAYEIATLGYRFVVHPTAYVLEAPTLCCDPALARFCDDNVTDVTNSDTGRFGEWGEEVMDFVTSLPKWEGRAREGRRAICYLPPYAFLSQLPRAAATDIAWQALQAVVGPFRGLGSLIREPEGDLSRAEWRHALRRVCFGQAVLVGRLAWVGGRGRVLLHREALGGYPEGEGESLRHYVQVGEGWGEARVVVGAGSEGWGGAGMEVVELPRGSVCEASVLREAPGWVRCRFLSKVIATRAEGGGGGGGGEEDGEGAVVVGDRQAWVFRDDDDSEWRDTEPAAVWEVTDSSRVDERLLGVRAGAEAGAWVAAVGSKEALGWTARLNKSTDLQDFRERMQAAERRHSQLPVRVTDSVYLSDARAAQDLGRLRGLGVTHVLNVAGQYADDLTSAEAYGAAGITLKTIPSNDDEEYPMLAMHLTEARHFVARARHEGGRVVVHCVAGLNRAGVVAAAVMMVHERRSVLEVVLHCRRVRGNSFLWNKSFQEQLVVLARAEGLLGVRPGLEGSVVEAMEGAVHGGEEEMARMDEDELRASGRGESLSTEEWGGGRAREEGEGEGDGGEAGREKVVVTCSLLEAPAVHSPLRFQLRTGPLTGGVQYQLSMSVQQSPAVIWDQQQTLELAGHVSNTTLGIALAVALHPGDYQLACAVLAGPGTVLSSSSVPFSVATEEGNGEVCDHDGECTK